MAVAASYETREAGNSKARCSGDDCGRKRKGDPTTQSLVGYIAGNTASELRDLMSVIHDTRGRKSEPERGR